MVFIDDEIDIKINNQLINQRKKERKTIKNWNLSSSNMNWSYWRIMNINNDRIGCNSNYYHISIQYFKENISKLTQITQIT